MSEFKLLFLGSFKNFFMEFFFFLFRDNFIIDLNLFDDIFQVLLESGLEIKSNEIRKSSGMAS